MMLMQESVPVLRILWIKHLDPLVQQEGVSSQESEKDYWKSGLSENLVFIESILL